MQIVQTISEMRQLRRELRQQAPPPRVGLVPTMGALHAGHLSLVREAKARCQFVVATIFVNPLQFGPKEDFGRYPRTFGADCALLEREGVDVLFAPAAEEMYPPGAETTVDVPRTGALLDGASRPGHFRGVATVVAKLFNIVQPDVAFFGQKDSAQVAVLRRMVRDLNFDLELVVCPTVRDTDGLALSSRNRYLGPAERESALVIPRALRHVEEAVAKGCTEVEHLRHALQLELQAADGLRLDYAEIVDAQTLEPAASLDGGALVAVAVWIGETRLIDNILLVAVKVAEPVEAAR